MDHHKVGQWWMEVNYQQIMQLHDINWGAIDHASRALQLMSCNYYLCVCVYMYVYAVYVLLYVCV